ncbi:hypothetical protein, partial [Vibrio alfacsensis]
LASVGGPLQFFGDKAKSYHDCLQHVANDEADVELIGQLDDSYRDLVHYISEAQERVKSDYQRY